MQFYRDASRLLIPWGNVIKLLYKKVDRHRTICMITCERNGTANITFFQEKIRISDLNNGSGWIDAGLIVKLKQNPIICDADESPWGLFSPRATRWYIRYFVSRRSGAYPTKHFHSAKNASCVKYIFVRFIRRFTTRIMTLWRTALSLPYLFKVEALERTCSSCVAGKIGFSSCGAF